MRAELLGQVVGARFALEEALAELARTGGGNASVQNQMHALTQLQRSIGSASHGDLATMRGEIAAAVAQTHAVIEQGRTAANGADAEGASLASLASRAQTQATSFMRDLRHYDGLLQFDSEEQEYAYRQREEERRQRVEAGMAQGTPQGALQASGAAYGQAVDLAAHGGSADPALMRRVDELAASTAALRAGLIRDGKDLSKFDEDMRTDLRAIMRSKGIPDERIDVLLAEYRDNPVNAMKAFVAEHQGSFTAKDMDAIEKTTDNRLNADRALRLQDQMAEQSAPAVLQAGMTASALDAMAELKASGVLIADHDIAAAPAHGVKAHAVSAANGKAALS